MLTLFLRPSGVLTSWFVPSCFNTTGNRSGSHIFTTQKSSLHILQVIPQLFVTPLAYLDVLRYPGPYPPERGSEPQKNVDSAPIIPLDENRFLLFLFPTFDDFRNAWVWSHELLKFSLLCIRRITFWPDNLQHNSYIEEIWKYIQNPAWNLSASFVRITCSHTMNYQLTSKEPVLRRHCERAVFKARCSLSSVRP